MSEGGYPNRKFIIADKFEAKSGITIRKGDVMVRTSVTKTNGSSEIAVWDESLYNRKNIVGISQIDKDSDYIKRAPKVSVNVKGADLVKVTEDVKQGDDLTGAGKQFTEEFTGDGTNLQSLQLEKPPVSSVVSVTEDPDGTPTVYTQVPWETEPSTDQYSYLETGEIVLGVSVNAALYRIVYNIDEGRLRKLKSIDTQVTETGITVTSHIGNISAEPEQVLYVEATAGTSTGAKTIIYTGSPSAGEVLVEGSKLTFNATDAVTTAKVIYKNDLKGCAKAMEDKSAGLMCTVYVDCAGN